MILTSQTEGCSEDPGISPRLPDSWVTFSKHITPSSLLHLLTVLHIWIQVERGLLQNLVLCPSQDTRSSAEPEETRWLKTSSPPLTHKECKQKRKSESLRGGRGGALQPLCEVCLHHRRGIPGTGARHEEPRAAGRLQTSSS